METSFKNLLFGLQEYALMVKSTFLGTFRCFKYKEDTMYEMYSIGVKSLWLVATGGFFIGVILALEVGHHLEVFGATTLIGRTVSLGLIRESGPIITGLLFAARTGAKNASEIGAMQLSEQIDALRAFGTSPVDKLVVPRTVAAVVMFLPLTLLADAFGLFGGMLISQFTFHVDSSFYWNSVVDALRMKDLFFGFTKPLFFAFFIASISCYFGLSTRGGTAGLGKNTINAVVTSSVMVIVLDFIYTKIIWSLV